VEQIECTLLEDGRGGDDLHDIVVHDHGVLGDCAQVVDQGLKAVNGLAIVGLPRWSGMMT
jgi:hypothetical protein